MRKNIFCSHFCHCGYNSFSRAVELLEVLAHYVNTDKETLSPFIDSSIDNVLLQTNSGCTSRF